MTPAPITSSRADHWTQPRWRDRARDAYHYGAIQPMQRPSLWQRVFGGKP